MTEQIRTKRLWWVSEYPKCISNVGALIVLLIGAVVLSGWTFHIPLLKRIVPVWPAMSPLTALTFAFAGLSLGLFSIGNCHLIEEKNREEGKGGCVTCQLAQILASMVILIAASRLALHFLGKPVGMDLLWLFHVEPGAAKAQMSPATAVNFLLLGSALVLGRYARLFPYYQACTMTAALIGWLGLSRYLYGGEAPLFYSNMAIHTAITFLILAMGTLCLRTERGLMFLLVSQTAGGVIMRRLLVPALVIPLILGSITQELQYLGWFDDEGAHTLFAISTVIVFAALVWWTASWLHVADLERRRIEGNLTASLKENQALQHALDEHAIVAITNPQGRITFVNDKFCAISKYSREELLGRDHRVISSGHHTKEFFRNLWATIESGCVWKGEVCNRAKDGSIYWVDTTIVPFLDSKGKPYQYVAIRADITERKQIELKVRHQLERLAMLHHITRAIGERQDLRSIFQVVVGSMEDQLAVDFSCVGIYSPELSELTITCVGGRSGDMALELAMTEQAHVPIDQNGLSRCVRGHLVYEPDIRTIPFPFPERLARGGLRSLVVSPLQVESNVFGVLLVARRKENSFSSGECEFLRQLSEHVALAAHQAQLNSALQKAYDDLRQTQQVVMQQERLRALGQMASGIAHDINNALSPAMLCLGALLDDGQNLSEQSRDYLETTQRAVEDVAATVARMREFYRPRELQLMLSPVNLNQMAEQVVDLTRARWNDIPLQRGIVIKMKTDLEDNLPNIIGAENEIREALVNLVFNAVDAMSHGGAVTLRTRTVEKTLEGETADAPALKLVRISVQDTGCGMDEETKARCLEPFYTTKGERGTGLGLAMVYGVAQRHCAEVDIESEVGKGTTIHLNFPLPSSPAIASPKKTVSMDRPLRLRVLLVDDDPVLLKSLTDTLEADGHLVTKTNGGQAGIDAFKQTCGTKEQFSVVITDLGMPHIDGRKVSAEIKSLSPDTPIILLTGWGERLVVEGDVPLHVDRVLSKPPKLAEIREALMGCCS